MKSQKQIMGALCGALFMSMFSASHALAISGSGNGGGGFCYAPGKCVTLAEAGLRIPVDIPLFMISEETEAEIRRILSMSPASASYIDKMTKRALGDRDTFISIQNEGKNAFRDVLDGYRKLIKTYAPNLPEDRFELYAVSDQNTEKTYLLPAFFELSPTRQALILIHEANVRGFSSSTIPYAVQLDGILYDFLTESPMADKLSFYIADYNLREAQLGGGADLATWRLRDNLTAELFESLVFFFSNKIGRNLRISDFCDRPSIYFDTCQVTRERALSGNRTFDPRFAQLFLDAKITASKWSDHGAFPGDYQIKDDVCNGVSSGDLVFDFVTYHNGSGSHIVMVACEEKSGKVIPTEVHFFDDFSGIKTK